MVVNGYDEHKLISVGMLKMRSFHLGKHDLAVDLRVISIML